MEVPTDGWIDRQMVGATDVGANGWRYRRMDRWNEQIFNQMMYSTFRAKTTKLADCISSILLI